MVRMILQKGRTAFGVVLTADARKQVQDVAAAAAASKAVAVKPEPNIIKVTGLGTQAVEARLKASAEKAALEEKALEAQVKAETVVQVAPVVEAPVAEAVKAPVVEAPIVETLTADVVEAPIVVTAPVIELRMADQGEDGNKKSKKRKNKG